jgi:hypothetical protein
MFDFCVMQRHYPKVCEEPNVSVQYQIEPGILQKVDLHNTIFRYQSLDWLDTFLFSKGYKFLELFKDKVLILHKIDPCETRQIMNECQNIPCTYEGR